MRNPAHVASVCLIAIVALLGPFAGCRPPTGEEVLKETDELFAEGSHKSAIKKLVIYMRRNPGEVALKGRRLDYLTRAGGVGHAIADQANDSIPESVKPSRDGYRGFLISWVEKGLKSEDASIRAAAVNALGDIGRGGGVKELKKMLDAGGDERATAINALVALKSGDAYQLLINEIAKPDVHPSMFEVAMPRRSPVPRILNGAIDSKDPGIRAGALLALAYAGIQGKHVVGVRARLSDPEGAVRGAAARALGSHRDTDSKAAIERMLAKDKEAAARAGAAAALGTLFDHASIGPLWAAFSDKSQPAEVRGEAGFSLSGFRCGEGSEDPCLTGAQSGAVKRARRDPALAPMKELLTLAAAELLDHSTRSSLKGLLMSDSKRIRTAAAKLLWQFDDKTIDKFLEAQLKDARDEASARKALVAFESWQSPELAPLVVEFASTKEVPKSLRLAAVRSMTRIGWKGREAAVTMFTNSSAPDWLRLAAAEAARTSLDSKNGDDVPLIGTLEKAGQNMLHTASPSLQEASLRLLIKYGDGKANRAALEKVVLKGAAKPVEIKDAPGAKELPPQHTRLLTYQIAALAKWL